MEKSCHIFIINLSGFNPLYCKRKKKERKKERNRNWLVHYSKSIGGSWVMGEVLLWIRWCIAMCCYLEPPSKVPLPHKAFRTNSHPFINAITKTVMLWFSLKYFKMFKTFMSGNVNKGLINNDTCIFFSLVCYFAQ